MIKGDKIYLTELDPANAETIRGWFNDPEVHRYLRVGHTPISQEEERRYYESEAASSSARNFEIHVAEDGRYIGNVGLKDIYPVHRSAELGIAVGSKEDWGKGAILLSPPATAFVASSSASHRIRSVACRNESASTWLTWA